MQAEKKTGAGEVTAFGCAAVVTGSLVDEQRSQRGRTALTVRNVSMTLLHQLVLI